jgi:hypothetical protein
MTHYDLSKELQSPKPDAKTVTPELLRHMFRGNEWVQACASAWEADRARVEALEHAARIYRNCADNYLFIANAFATLEATHQEEYAKWLGALDAALAAGEVKHE